MSDQVTDSPIEFVVTGDVPQAAAAYALRRVERALGKVHRPVLHARVRLVNEPNPAYDRPARVEIAVEVNGTPIRAHVAASTLTEATDLAIDRLQRRVAQLRERTRTRHRWRAVATEHEWRHGSTPPRPALPDDQQVIRRKTVALEPMTPDEAAYEMDLLDHDFYLFAGRDGADAVVYRTGQDGYGLLGPAGAPVLSLATARDRLRVGRERFVFYRDPVHGRGHVLYLRHDGRYGLLVAAEKGRDPDPTPRT
jgi:ribosomal subunit interface protein